MLEFRLQNSDNISINKNYHFPNIFYKNLLQFLAYLCIVKLHTEQTQTFHIFYKNATKIIKFCCVFPL